MPESYDLKLTDDQYKQTMLYMLMQLNANTIALHDHLLKFQAKDNEHYDKLCNEALTLRKANVNQILQYLYGKFGAVDFDDLMK